MAIVIGYTLTAEGQKFRGRARLPRDGQRRGYRDRIFNQAMTSLTSNSEIGDASPALTQVTGQGQS
jgi:hypothetical protein